MSTTSRRPLRPGLLRLDARASGGAARARGRALERPARPRAPGRGDRGRGQRAPRRRREPARPTHASTCSSWSTRRATARGGSGSITRQNARLEAAQAPDRAIRNEVEPRLAGPLRRRATQGGPGAGRLRRDEAARALPAACPYTLDQLLDRGWLPANRHGLTDRACMSTSPLTLKRPSTTADLYAWTKQQQAAALRKLAAGRWNGPRLDLENLAEADRRTWAAHRRDAVVKPGPPPAGPPAQARACAQPAAPPAVARHRQTTPVRRPRQRSDREAHRSRRSCEQVAGQSHLRRGPPPGALRTAWTTATRRRRHGRRCPIASPLHARPDDTTRIAVARDDLRPLAQALSKLAEARRSFTLHRRAGSVIVTSVLASPS